MNIYATDKSEYFSIIDKTFKSKNYIEGITSLEKAVKEYPDEANFHSNLVFIYWHSKRFSDAIKRLLKTYAIIGGYFKPNIKQVRSP